MEQKLLDIRQTAKALGMRNHRKLQNVCNRLPGFPAAIKLEDGPFKPVFYAEREIVAYGKTHNITDELRKVYTQIRKEGKARRAQQKKDCLAAPESIEFQFLRGDFAPAEVRATFKS